MPEHIKHDHDVEIVVNGRKKTVPSKTLTFDEVVGLAFDQAPTGPNVLFTVTFRRGEGHKPEGTLVQGETLKVKEGMIVNITATDRS
jgi:hypothetical protein